MDVICPSLDYGVDGADMYSLVMPPPARVSFRVLPEDGHVVLSARAGVDRSIFAEREKELQGHKAVFTVRINGSKVFEKAIPIRRASESPGTEWIKIGDGKGVTLGAGDEVTLETALQGPDGSDRTPAFEFPAGFGGLSLLRSWHVRRTVSSPQRPNIVLIVMDTLRRDRLSVYGYSRPTSPNLEMLARRGVVYEQAYSTSSWTWPSTASILTGMHPEEHGVLDEDSCFLHPGLFTLSEALQRRGFTTSAYSGNPLIVPDKNFDQGFEFFNQNKSHFRKSKFIVPRALEWLEAIAGTRFFLYLHLVDPHCPLDPHPRGRELFADHVPEDFSSIAIRTYNDKLLQGAGHTPGGEFAIEQCVPDDHRRWISDMYDACVWTGDYWVGKLLDRMERLGLLDETVVLFTSDHGEGLFDHVFAMHGLDLHAEQVRVPLILAGPGIPRGERVDIPVSNRQVAPTLVRFGGADLPSLQNPLDLTRFDDLRRSAGEPILFSTRRGWWNGRHPLNILRMRLKDKVLHFAPEAFPWPGGEAVPNFRCRLFDFSQDAKERRDLAMQDALWVEGLRKVLYEKVETLEKRRRSPSIRAGDATLEMLRGIGYIGGDD